MNLRALHRATSLLPVGVLLASSIATATPQSDAIVIDKMKFGPVPVELHKGDTVVWINHDILRHSATATNHGFDIDLPPGASKRMLLTKSGTFPFVCRYHPGMYGTLIVR